MFKLRMDKHDSKFNSIASIMIHNSNVIIWSLLLALELILLTVTIGL